MKKMEKTEYDEEQMKDIIESIKEDKKQRDIILKKANGCFYLEIVVPEISEEDFEQWNLGTELGDKVGYTRFITYCTGRTLTVAHNILRHIVQKIEAENPELLLHALMADLKKKMTIDEEDLEDYES